MFSWPKCHVLVTAGEPRHPSLYLVEYLKVAVVGFHKHAVLTGNMPGNFSGSLYFVASIADVVHYFSYYFTKYKMSKLDIFVHLSSPNPPAKPAMIYCLQVAKQKEATCWKLGARSLSITRSLTER